MWQPFWRLCTFARLTLYGSVWPCYTTAFFLRMRRRRGWVIQGRLYHMDDILDETRLGLSMILFSAALNLDHLVSTSLLENSWKNSAEKSETALWMPSQTARENLKIFRVFCASNLVQVHSLLPLFHGRNNQEWHVLIQQYLVSWW